MNSDTRERVRQQYNNTGSTYDDVRLADPRGAVLSNHDVWLFNRMFAPGDKAQPFLEIGAGTGRFTLPVLEQGFRVVATDINKAMLEVLQGKVEDRGFTDRCETRTADVFRLTFESEAFEYVYSLHVLPRFLTLDDQRAALTEMARVLKPGGVLFFNYRNARSVYRWLHRGHSTTPKQMHRMLAECGMKVVEKRGKWFLNRKLVNSLPLFAGRLVSRVDRGLERFWPNHAWDVFVIAVKQ